MDNSLKASVTCWIQDLKEGNDDAAQLIWERYFQRLVRVAERRLGNAPRRVADEEDVAVSVFDSLCHGAAQGRFNKLSNRDDLWRLLVAISRMKAADQIRRLTAKKRGGQDLRGESVVVARDGDTAGGFDQFLAADPTPEFLLLMEEQKQQLFDALPDDSQRKVARFRLDGCSNEEIAESVGISLRSVERKLKIVREIWSRVLAES